MDDMRTHAGMEGRRRMAVRRVDEGLPAAQVAAVLGLHVETVRRWVRAHKAGGDDALAGTPHPGRAPFLSPEQERSALGWLADKPTAHGFRTDLWTARRVADLIRRRFRVGFHPSYLREWLTKRGYSPQKPAPRARERDHEAVAEWLRGQWPDLLKKRATRPPTSC